MSVFTCMEGQLACASIDNPPVNATSQAVRAGLMAAIESVENPAVRAVILRCAGHTFVAGANVNEFNRPPEATHLPDVIRAIEQSSRPWVAACEQALDMIAGGRPVSAMA